VALDPERRTALRGAKLRALVAEATDGASVPEPDGDHLFDGTRLWTLASEDEPGSALGVGLLRAGRHGDATPLTVCFDNVSEAALAARWVTALEPTPEVRHVDGRSLVTVAPADEPNPTTDRSPDGFAVEFDDLCRGVGVEPILEHGTWRGEVLGLEVVRAVDGIDPMTGELEGGRSDGLSGARPMIEVGVGRFDREAGVLMRAGRSDAEALAAAADLVRAQRRPGAGAHPLATLARERWMRRDLCAHPELLDLVNLMPVDPAAERLNLRDPAPAPAVGSDADGGRVLVICSVGVDPHLVSAAAELVLREVPDRVVVALPTRDVMTPVERVMARLRVPTTVVGVACSWDA
jgi:hypothetical protein